MDILYPYWCYLGVPMDRVSFTLWAALLNSYISSGAVIPENRSHEIVSVITSYSIHYTKLYEKI